MIFKKNALFYISCLMLLASLCACGSRVPDNSSSLMVDMPTIAYKAMLAPPMEMQTNNYAYIEDNGFKDPLQSPLSTFSVDVDTASYSNVRRMLNDNTSPEPGAVRIEEMINYFRYDYPQPDGESPVNVYSELSDCPWADGHKLLHVGLQTKIIDMQEAPQSNLVFLIDVSGSMYDELTLVKRSLRMLVEQMRVEDRISIVVYAGAAGVVLPPTSGANKEKITKALQDLEAGGATAGSEGIELAYKLAAENLIKRGNNRIILATDGDFNVGLSSESALVRLIESKRDQGIYLTILGFGSDNYNDVIAENLADHGNGTYVYIDNLLEANKALVKEAGGTLVTVAKDVKVQVEFNPARVRSYRLIGYENRLMDAEDFANDIKDAGDMGAGHSVTALYEIIPRDGLPPSGSGLRYQQPTAATEARNSSELALVKYCYKKPDAETSQLLSFTVDDAPLVFADSSENQRFAAAVAAWGMLLRDSPYKGTANLDWIIATAKNAKGDDVNGDRAEFIKLVELSKMLMFREE